MFVGCTGTSSSNGNSSGVDIKELNRVSNMLTTSLYDSFKGMPVVIDDELEGMSWHIAMSREMFNELVRREEAKP